MPKIDTAKILIMATDGYERSELREPLDRLKAAGATVHIASPEGEEITSWDETSWGDAIASDLKIADVDAGDYDALVLPGGQINPDILRTKKDAVALVKTFHGAGKPVAAICHGPWMLVEADLVLGRRVTAYPSIRTDLSNAGAEVVDEEVVQDAGLITSRNPDDLPAFCDTIITAVESSNGLRAVA
ncbi:type 1 glutamine amidotransferase domain-containing protein [Aestuariibius sp. 2305UL40-4]|uniref:type 1 glutamine amidotransferase domain-containing protein n=1 Tax=Aestuariibius violaceus TaxID=3234132 RepID=UPI00345EE4E3